MNGVARTALWLALSVLGIGAIGLLDHASGTDYRIFPLYYLPVSLGAWYAGRAAAVGLAAISSVVWVVVNATVAESGNSLVVAVNFGILVVAATGVGLLVAVLRRRLDAERDLGRIDSLTGLPNHRAFHERGELLLASARRYGRPVAIAYLDLDDFKAINDSHGHGEGDRVLQELGRILKEQTRSADLVARLGGDEFAILLVETGADAAAALLERLRRLIDDAMRARRWPTSVTIGAVSFPEPPASLDVALGRADAALYAAKRAGKRRVVQEVIVAPSAG